MKNRYQILCSATLNHALRDAQNVYAVTKVGTVLEISRLDDLP